MRVVLHLLWIGVLTVVTQLGGIAWLLSLMAKRPWIAFPFAYTALWLTATLTAPMVGRAPLPCWGDGPLQAATPLYCAMNRHYVTPQMLKVAQDLAQEQAARFPGTQTLALDGSFPFFDGFPLLPHLSHDDGEKLDLAFYYTDTAGTYLPGKMRSPLGYFAFEQGPTQCLPSGPTLRWNFGAVQPLFPDYPLDEPRLSAALTHLADDPRVGKILLEPHLKAKLGLTSPKIRFQGCRAARHDDHIHFQLTPKGLP